MKNLSTKHGILNKYKSQNSKLLNIGAFRFGYYLEFRDWDLELSAQERTL